MRMRSSFGLLFLLILATQVAAQPPVRWMLSRSLVSFTSDAPLEHISATNKASSGVIEIGTRSFAMQLPVKEFEGFNAPLQREHFNENFLVSRTWPYITFSGRIIESIDLLVPNKYNVRAKGKLVVRGVEKERIIPCDVVVAEDGIRVTSTFDVALDEYDIRIPRVVHQKIAEVVQVKVDALFLPPGK